MPIQHPSDNNPLMPSGHGSINTAGVVQGLRGDPNGRYVFVVNDGDNEVVYSVRANTRAEAWNKLREHKEGGTYVNTGACTVQERTTARGNDPQIAVHPKGYVPA